MLDDLFYMQQMNIPGEASQPLSLPALVSPYIRGVSSIVSSLCRTVHDGVQSIDSHMYKSCRRFFVLIKG